MYKAKHILAVCMLLLAGNAVAQYTPAIRSVRPGATVAPNTVGKGILQFHIDGYRGWDGRSDDTSAYFNSFAYADMLVCYGITNKLELNLLTETRNDKIEINNRKLPQSGISLAALGVRYTISEGSPRSPSVGLQGLVKFKAQSQDYQPRNMATRALLLLGYEPTYIVSMSANLGLDFSGNNTPVTALYSFRTNVRLAPELGAYIETFGNYNRRYLYNNIGVGLYYFITNDFQVHASTGYGIRKDQFRGFINLGVAFRFATMGIPNQMQYNDYYE
ncbi:hypothetical protein CAP35_09850 [Chitinophagaceae bacterium IBVUCB1]|nr:hypothetical protein CAP35_09850 [Chitinophagaceae bacterium IBVUCB1]